MNQEQPKTTDRRDLKIMALQQSMSELVVKYEDKDADRRIEITEYSHRVQELEGYIAGLEQRANELESRVQELLAQQTPEVQDEPVEEEVPAADSDTE